MGLLLLLLQLFRISPRASIGQVWVRLAHEGRVRCGREIVGGSSLLLLGVHKIVQCREVLDVIAAGRRSKARPSNVVVGIHLQRLLLLLLLLLKLLGCGLCLLLVLLLLRGSGGRS